MPKKITDEDMLHKAGVLAIAAEAVLGCRARHISGALDRLEKALLEYNITVMQATKEREKEE